MILYWHWDSIVCVSAVCQSSTYKCLINVFRTAFNYKLFVGTLVQQRWRQRRCINWKISDFGWCDHFPPVCDSTIYILWLHWRPSDVMQFLWPKWCSLWFYSFRWCKTSQQTPSFALYRVQRQPILGLKAQMLDYYNFSYKNIFFLLLLMLLWAWRHQSQSRYNIWGNAR